ncbi:AMP-binding protein [Alteromonas facilis]|uniref:AMP-binding protein n=1 Tax=Alteromonas facilis TaxID=2048004 RepID=UPI000F5C9A60|nr:AMP-binding protein [Alteromonas facilis]
MFFQHLDQFSENSAFIEVKPNESSGVEFNAYTYRQLAEDVHVRCDVLNAVLPQSEATERYLVALKMHACVASVVDYLALLSNSIVVILIDPAISDDKLDSVIQQYAPNAIVDEGHITIRHTATQRIDSRVALMLPTSGSTGAAKHVVLSYDNLHSNADAICQYLPILPSDRAINTLPLFYSYGLSVLNTHLLRGGCLVFSPYSVVNREFWSIMRELPVTSFAGVPHTYEMLHKLRFERQELPSLRYFTQAGGRLKDTLVLAFAHYAEQHEKQFFVMYGQTEATARMAFLPPHKLIQKANSIGQAIPNGEFSIVDNELCYRGPNVMLGYSESVSDLAEFIPIEWLHTGDFARVDAEGDYYILGRKARFIKLNGVRMDLDAIQDTLAAQGYTALCSGNDSQLVVALESVDVDEQAAVFERVKRYLHQTMHVHPSLITLLNVERLPLTANGKPDYQAIMRLASLSDE